MRIFSTFHRQHLINSVFSAFCTFCLAWYGTSQTGLAPGEDDLAVLVAISVLPRLQCHYSSNGLNMLLALIPSEVCSGALFIISVQAMLAFGMSGLLICRTSGLKVVCTVSIL